MDTLDPNTLPCKLVFRGEILAGHDASETRLKLQRALNLSPEAITKLFSQPTTLKKNLPPHTARKLRTQLASLGAKVHVVQEQPATRPAAPLQLVEQEPAPTAPEPAETDSAATVAEVMGAAEKESASPGKITVWLPVTAGLTLMFIYSPLTSGIFKNGFALGAAFLASGVYRYLKVFR